MNTISQKTLTHVRIGHCNVFVNTRDDMDDITKKHISRFLLCLDVSGSMKYLVGSGRSRLDLLKEMVRHLIRQFPSALLSIVVFNHEAKLLATDISAAEVSAILDTLTPDGLTDFVNLFQHIKESDIIDPHTQIVIITDGEHFPHDRTHTEAMLIDVMTTMQPQMTLLWENDRRIHVIALASGPGRALGAAHKKMPNTFSYTLLTSFNQRYANDMLTNLFRERWSFGCLLKGNLRTVFGNSVKEISLGTTQRNGLAVIFYCDEPDTVTVHTTEHDQTEVSPLPAPVELSSLDQVTMSLLVKYLRPSLLENVDKVKDADIDKLDVTSKIMMHIIKVVYQLPDDEVDKWRTFADVMKSADEKAYADMLNPDRSETTIEMSSILWSFKHSLENKAYAESVALNFATSRDGRLTPPRSPPRVLALPPPPVPHFPLMDDDDMPPIPPPSPFFGNMQTARPRPSARPRPTARTPTPPPFAMLPPFSPVDQTPASPEPRRATPPPFAMLSPSAMLPPFSPVDQTPASPEPRHVTPPPFAMLSPSAMLPPFSPVDQTPASPDPRRATPPPFAMLSPSAMLPPFSPVDQTPASPEPRRATPPPFAMLSPSAMLPPFSPVDQTPASPDPRHVTPPRVIGMPPMRRPLYEDEMAVAASPFLPPTDWNMSARIEPATPRPRFRPMARTGPGSTAEVTPPPTSSEPRRATPPRNETPPA